MSVNIALVPLPPEQPTSYMSGGRTRHADGSVPHISMVRTVGQLGGGTPWRLSAGSAKDWNALVAKVVELDGEPPRLTEAERDARVQAVARQGYELWDRAGRPSPGTARWSVGMKAAYVAKPGESGHGWGGAVDIDVGALVMPGCARGSNQALAAFWIVAAQFGWRPIITKPSVGQSECWHFDHFGPLRAVYNLFKEHSADPKYLGVSYGQTARAGAALAGTLPASVVADVNVAYLQARLSLGGIFVGLIDGVLGPKTREGLKAAGVSVPTKPRPTALLPELDATGLAADLIAAA